jgi:hypothetical protein
MGVVVADLAALPGAPFTQAEVDAAVTAVRNAARWHIAPSLSQTVTLDVECRDPVLRLPTRHLTAVTAIRDTDTGDVIAASRYRVSLTVGEVRAKCGFWPVGYGRVAVDMTHGYATVPADLLPVLAEAAFLSRRDQTATQFSAGPFSIGVNLSDTGACDPLSTSAVLERYTFWQSGLA